VIAENAVGCSPPSESSDPLTVTLQRNAIQSIAPKFLAELEDFNGIENEKVEFKVRVIGTPAPQVSWFKDGFEIFSSRRAKIITENDTSTLIFYQSSLTDEGEIKCTATNRAGYAFTKSRLIIEAPPKIRLPRQYEDGLIIEADEVIRLKVGIAGRPVPSVQWSHNGEVIGSGGRYEISSNDKNSTLKISNSSRTDRGEYFLRAANTLGEDATSFLVTVTARPTQPGKISIKVLPLNTVTLTWAPPEDDGGCKIGNYIVEYFRIGWNVWLKAATCRTLAVTLNDLISGSEYKFRVKAENPYGVSDPSEDSDVLFIPDAKRGITDPTKSRSLPPREAGSEFAPVAPKRRTSPSPARSKLTESIEQQKKPSPIPQIKLNTNIFDDDTIERDMSYGASDDFYKFGEVPSTSLHERSDLEQQVRQLKNAKNNVKFNDNPQTKTVDDEPIYANLPNDNKPSNSESVRDDLRKFASKRAYLDLSKTGGGGDADRSIQNSSEFMLVLYADKDSKGGNSRFFTTCSAQLMTIISFFRKRLF
jgi:titin